MLALPSRPGRLTLTWLMGALLSGCGDGGPSDPGADAASEDTRFTAPGDFDRAGCAPGGLAGGAAAQIFHYRLERDGAAVLLSARVDPAGSSIEGRDAAWVAATDDDLVMRRIGSQGDLLALHLCGGERAGAVRGTRVACSAAGTCDVRPVEGEELRSLDEPTADGLRLLGEHGPWPASLTGAGVSVNVRVVDDLAYLVRLQDGLRIVDVRDPARMVERGHLAPERPDRTERYNDVKIVDGPTGRRYALLASNRTGVVIADVTDPARPAVVGHLGTSHDEHGAIDVHTVFVAGRRAYLATRGVDLEIYDVADPTAPVRLGGYALPGEGYLHDLFVAGDRAYLNAWDQGLVVLDVADPATPRRLGGVTVEGPRTSHSSWVTRIGERTIAVHGDEGWDAHLHLIDVTEGTAGFATAIAAWRTRPAVSIHNVMAIGERAVIAHYQDGVRVLDLADPAAPRPLAHYQTWTGAAGHPDYGRSAFDGAVGIDVDPGRGRIYVADSHRGLLVLETGFAPAF